MSYKTPVEFLQHSGVLESDFGYSFVSWVPNPSGRYRPKVKRLEDDDVNTDILVRVTGDHLYIKTYREIKDKKEFGYYDFKTADTVTEGASMCDGEAEDTGPSDIFLSAWERLEKVPELELGEHPTFTEKGLLPLSGHRKACKYQIIDPNGGNFDIDAVFVPFINSDGLVVGAQYRDVHGKKLSIPASKFYNSFHVVQKGGVDVQAGHRIGIFSESYTTALELAAARPHDTVVCCAGQSLFSNVFKLVNTVFPDVYWVAALDKNKKKNHKLPQFAKTEKLIQEFKDAQLPYILPEKVDFRFHNCTDFNDMAVIDRQLTHEYITFCIQQQLALPPKVIGNEDGVFTIISSVDNTLRRVSHSAAPKMVRHIAPEEFWIQNGITESTDIINFLCQQNLLTSGIKMCGIGVFKEKDCTILNTTRGRYMHRNGVIRPLTSPNVYNNFYVNMGSINPVMPAATPDIGAYKQFKQIFTQIYGLKDGDFLFLMGYFLHAAYAATLQRRSHLWLTGVSGRGKSTLIDERISKVFAGLFLLTEDITEAWVRQELAEDSAISTSPLIYMDEVFDDVANKKKMHMLQMIMTMIRSAASNVDKVSGRGRSDQNNSSLVKRFCAILSSKAHYFTDLQDHSRFILYEMTHNIKKSTVGDFIEFNRASEALAPTMSNILLTSVDEYITKYDVVLEDIRSEYGEELMTLSHLDMGLAAVVTGAKIINEKLGGEMLTNKELIRLLSSRLGYNVSECASFQAFENEPLATQLFNVYVRTRFGETKLYKALIEANTKEEFFDLYGIRLVPVKNMPKKFCIEVCKGLKKAHLLLADFSVVKNPIHYFSGQFKHWKEENPLHYVETLDHTKDKPSRVYRVIFSNENSLQIQAFLSKYGESQ